MYRVHPMDASNRFDILIHVQPWQMLLLDGEQIADLAAGDLGATGLTLSAKVPQSQDAVILSPGDNLQAIRLAPGTLFHPNPDHYASTRLRPVVSPTLKSRQPIGKIVEVARQRKLRVRLRLSALRDAATAGKHPEIVSCNALSLASPAHLCAGNPDVIELVRCELLDLTSQFAPDGIELEDFTAPERSEPAAGTCSWPIQPGPVESALLAICFCPSCQQQAIHAGIDASLALRSVQVHLTRWLKNEKPHPGTIDDMLAEDEILARYVARQKEALLAAIGIWTRAVPNVSLVVAKDDISAPWNPSYEDVAGIGPHLTLLTTPQESLHQFAPADVVDSPDRKVEAAINATSPSFAAGPDIVRCLGDLARAGVSAVVLEDGLGVSPSRWPFLRQAIRTARRERSP